MVTFKTRKVGPMFVDSLLEHNVVALNVVAEDLKRRGEQKIFPNLIFKAFGDNFIFPIFVILLHLKGFAEQ